MRNSNWNFQDLIQRRAPYNSRLECGTLNLGFARKKPISKHKFETMSKSWLFNYIATFQICTMHLVSNFWAT
jgi:hypothetical protein